MAGDRGLYSQQNEEMAVVTELLYQVYIKVRTTLCVEWTYASRAEERPAGYLLPISIYEFVRRVVEVGEQVKVCDVALKFIESGRVKVEGIVIHCCSSNNARETLETAAGTEGIKATAMPQVSSFGKLR